MCVTALETSPVPASPFDRIIAAPSVSRRSASPRLVAPQTQGTVDCRGLMLRGCSRRNGTAVHRGVVQLKKRRQPRGSGQPETSDDPAAAYDEGVADGVVVKPPGEVGARRHDDEL